MRHILTVCLLLCAAIGYSQDPHLKKFGSIAPTDFVTSHPIDADAAAVVLYDQGATTIEGNNKGWFSARFTRHKLIHILSKPGYGEADISIYLFRKDDDEERLSDIKAVTYNLEAGKLVQTKLDKSGIFYDKKDKNRTQVKFTMPAVKEGCIIEFQYEVMSDYYWQIDDWFFQDNIPTLWSEYIFSVPQFFSYGFLSSGYHAFHVSDRKNRQGQFTVVNSGGTSASQRSSFGAGITDYRWVKKDVPALVEESFTSTLTNHISRIEFTLSSQSEPLAPRDFRSSWTKLTKDLMESEYFGASLNSGNGWMDEDLQPLLKGATTDAEKSRRIYAFVRDKFSCTNHRARSTEGSLKNVFKLRKGNVAEINLLLVAMLRHAGVKAEPVILSRSHYGYTYELYPGIDRFNYVIAKADFDSKPVYLDAAQSLGFGKLSADCYNGHARVVNEQAAPVYFVADSLHERTVTAVFLNNDAKGLWSGSVSQTPGYYHSYSLRNRIKEKGREKYFQELEKELGAEVSISNSRVDSMENFDEPISIRYEIGYNLEKEDILYINPMFGEGYKKNPFKSADRKYPVEMPYTMDETFILNLEVPEGYQVDELPKQLVARYDEDGQSFFEYRIQQSGNVVSMRSRIKLARAYFEPDEYAGLREFFNLVVKKHNEQIVFKKKKSA